MAITKIAFYVSGHGFGHVTRTWPLLQYCRQQQPSSVEWTLCSPHPVELLASLLPPDAEPWPQPYPNLRIRSLPPVWREADGVVQLDGVRIDGLATRHRLERLRRQVLEADLAGDGSAGGAWLVEEQQWLRDEAIDWVLSDVSFMAVWVADRCGVPAVLISNFLWDTIYDAMLATTTHAPNPSGDTGGDLVSARHWVSHCYRSALGWFRLPGHLESPAFFGTSCRTRAHQRSPATDASPGQAKSPGPSTTPAWIVDVPAIVRGPSREFHRDACLLRIHQHMGCPLSAEDLLASRLVLIMFGGHRGVNFLSQSDQLVPYHSATSPPWTFLMVGQSSSSASTPAPQLTGSPQRRVNFLSLTTDQCASIHVPDLVAASDMVIGKLGYGTCGECLAAGCPPFIFVPRDGFVEEGALVEWMRQEYRDPCGNGVIELSVADFQAGRWSAALDKACHWQWKRYPESMFVSGEATVCDHLMQLIRDGPA